MFGAVSPTPSLSQAVSCPTKDNNNKNHNNVTKAPKHSNQQARIRTQASQINQSKHASQNTAAVLERVLELLLEDLDDILVCQGVAEADPLRVVLHARTPHHRMLYAEEGVENKGVGEGDVVVETATFLLTGLNPRIENEKKKTPTTTTTKIEITKQTTRQPTAPKTPTTLAFQNDTHRVPTENWSTTERWMYSQTPSTVLALRRMIGSLKSGSWPRFLVYTRVSDRYSHSYSRGGKGNQGGGGRGGAQRVSGCVGAWKGVEA